MGLKRRAALSGLGIRIASLRYRPLGISGRRLDYRRFVVMSYQRCGSTMLTTALKGHSRAHCYGEIFNRDHCMLWTPGYDNHSRWLNLIRDHRPEVFLDRFIFRGYRQDIDAVGFKVFPSHAQDARFRHVIDSLIGDPEVEVVHLYRVNKLAVYTSLARARDSGVWATRQRGRGAPAAVVLDPDECLSGLADLEGQEQYFRDILKDRPHLQVSYEELTAARDAHYGRVLEHIGLPPEDMSSLTVKQGGRVLEDQIENYAELVERFRGTRYGSYFDA